MSKPGSKWIESKKYPKQYTLGVDDGEKAMYTEEEIALAEKGYGILYEYRASRKSRADVEAYQKEIKPTPELTYSDNEFGGNWRLWSKEGDVERIFKKGGKALTVTLDKKLDDLFKNAPKTQAEADKLRKFKPFPKGAKAKDIDYGGLDKSDNYDYGFEYRLLGRLQSDNDYFLGNGNRSERHLWAGSIDAQIKEMKRLWNMLPKKPEWLSMEDILEYEKKMKEPVITDKVVSKERYEEMLGTVPPIYIITLDDKKVKGGFAVGEIYSHEMTNAGVKPIYNAFYQSGKQFFEVMDKVYFTGNGEAVRAIGSKEIHYKPGGKVTTRVEKVWRGDRDKKFLTVDKNAIWLEIHGTVTEPSSEGYVYLKNDSINKVFRKGSGQEEIKAYKKNKDYKIVDDKKDANGNTWSITFLDTTDPNRAGISFQLDDIYAKGGTIDIDQEIDKLNEELLGIKSSKGYAKGGETGFIYTIGGL
jgi:hypothetical protein